MRLKRWITTTTAVAALAVAGSTGAAHADPAVPGTFNTLTPTRVLDTRYGTGAPTARLASHATLTFDAAAGLTGPVGSVTLTITAVNPALGGWLTAFPAGAPRPLASTVNFPTKVTSVNTTIVPVGTNGQVSVYNGSPGPVDVLADLTGWTTAGTVDPATGGALNVITPARVLDTRLGANVPVGPRSTTKVPILGKVGVPQTNVSAVAVNVTEDRATSAGYFSVGAEGPQPGSVPTSTLNYLARQTRANMAIVPVNPDGSISVYNGSAGSTHLIIDVEGYVSGGTPSADGSVVPSTAFRALDTREGLKPIPALTSAKLQLLPDDGTAAIFKAAVINLTVAAPQSSGFITAWDGLTPLPPTSNNNFRTNDNGAAAVIVPINPDGTITVYNGSFGNIDVIVDIDGFVLGTLPAPACATNCAAPSTATAQARQHTIDAALAKVHAFAARH